MKFLSLLAFSAVFLSFFSSAQSNLNVVGEWTWISSGCRDSDLSKESHVSKAKSQNPEDIETGSFSLSADGSARMTYRQDGDSMDFNGNYTVNNGRVSLRPSGGGGAFILEIVGDSLMVVRGERDLDDSQSRQRLRDVCGQGRVFVYVLAKV